MLLDLENLFSDEQAVKETVVSDNTIKMGGVIKEVSFGVNLPLIIQVVEDFSGIASLKVGVETADNEAFNNAKTLVETQAVAVAELKAGYKFPVNFIPKGNLGFMRLKYTVTAANPAATTFSGKITAGITAGHDYSYQDV